MNLTGRAKAACYASLATLLHVAVIQTGVFDSVMTELGFDTYAEEPILFTFLPFQVMPMNTLINFGYFLVGLCWYNTFIKLDDFIGESFCWYSMIYCFIQLVRMLYQTQRSAVLDQWVTTTIFCHVLVWIISVPCDGPVSRFLSKLHPAVIVLVSFMSYFASLISDIGFDVALVVHIVLVICVGIEALKARGDAQSRSTFYRAILCCVGFVVLKLADLPLRDYWTPNCISGHFLSKICDVAQIHYAAKLVWSLNLVQQIKSK